MARLDKQEKDLVLRVIDLKRQKPSRYFE
jgi:hypothetical protein